jgi:signal recognition particle subunit SRP72
LREAGIELLRSSSPGELKLAGSAFEKLFNKNCDTHIAAAGLVASLATSDPQKADQHTSQLPPIDDLVGAVDVKNLIAAGVASLPKSSAAPKRRATDDEVDKTAAKKRRKRKLPENYDPNKTPDPERWLPLRDRSSYRPKGKKGKKKVTESTQGGVVKEEETLGLVGGGDVKVERAPAASGASKKKKKGKK